MSVSGLPCFTLNANCCTGDGLALSSLSALSSASLSHPRVIASLVIRWGFLVVAVIMTKIMVKPIKITVSLDGQVVGSGCQSKQQAKLTPSRDSLIEGGPSAPCLCQVDLPVVICAYSIEMRVSVPGNFRINGGSIFCFCSIKNLTLVRIRNGTVRSELSTNSCDLQHKWRRSSDATAAAWARQ